MTLLDRSGRQPPSNVKTIIEPFRIHSVQPIRMSSYQEREAILTESSWNPFGIRAADIVIDLLTDSGTGAMSSAQWAAIMLGDESYAGADSWFRFEAAVKDLTGFRHVIPTHQGRAAERILFSCVNVRDKIVPANSHFDTTRANVEAAGGRAVDLPCREAASLSVPAPFKGNMDVAALERLIDQEGAGRIALTLVTVTNNTGGGQPVSLQNLREIRALTQRHGIAMYLDACRFAENAWLIREREPGQAGRSLHEIAHEMFSLADGCTFSAKKDGLANIGGFLALHDDDLARQERDLLVLTEGFPTYGGMAGRDLEAIAVGLREVLEEDYLSYRIASVAYLAQKLEKAGVPTMQPPGGHAVYVDAGRFLPHIPPEQLPGQVLVCELYLAGGIRAVEIGTLMLGGRDPITGQPRKVSQELVRLALPRRVYTQSHVDYVGEVMVDIAKHRDEFIGLEIVEEAAFLRHFTARMRPLSR